MEPEKTYINNQVEWLKSNDEKISEFFKAEIKSIREAVDKVEKNNEHYRASQNEWRGTLNELTTRLATKSAQEELIKRIEKLELVKSNLEGKMWVVSAGWGILVLLISWYLSK